MKRLLFTLTLFWLPFSSFGHDFWIEPSTFRPKPGSFVQIRLRVGEHYLGDPVPRKPDSLLNRFEAVTTEETLPIVGREGRDPAGVFRVEEEGMIVVAYYNKPSFVEVPPEKLVRYLGDEGLERIATPWMRSHAGKKPWREIYSRCAKAILWTGKGPNGIYNKNLGLPLELIPEKNPVSLAARQSFPVQLLYQGQPLAGALVIAIPRAKPLQRIALRSDRKGRVRFKLPAEGEWLIKAVHLFPAPAGAEGEWQSLWASLTFETRPTK